MSRSITITPQPPRDEAVLRRTYEAAKRLAELLEMVGMGAQASTARRIRQDVWLRLSGGDPADRCVCGVPRDWGRHEPCGQRAEGFCHTLRCHPFEDAAA